MCRPAVHRRPVQGVQCLVPCVIWLWSVIKLMDRLVGLTWKYLLWRRVNFLVCMTPQWVPKPVIQLWSQSSNVALFIISATDRRSLWGQAVTDDQSCWQSCVCKSWLLVKDSICKFKPQEALYSQSCVSVLNFSSCDVISEGRPADQLCATVWWQGFE